MADTDRDTRRKMILDTIARLGVTPGGSSTTTTVDPELEGALKKQQTLDFVSRIGQGLNTMLGPERSRANAGFYEGMRENGPVNQLATSRKVRAQRQSDHASSVANLYGQLNAIDRLDQGDETLRLRELNLNQLGPIREYLAQLKGNTAETSALKALDTAMGKPSPQIQQQTATADKLTENISKAQGLMTDPATGQPKKDAPGVGPLDRFKGRPFDFTPGGMVSAVLDFAGQVKPEDRQMFTLRQSLANDYARMITGLNATEGQYRQLFGTYGLDGSSEEQMRTGLKQMSEDIEAYKQGLAPPNHPEIVEQLKSNLQNIQSTPRPSVPKAVPAAAPAGGKTVVERRQTSKGVVVKYSDGTYGRE